MNNVKKKKSVAKIVRRVFIIFSIIGILSWAALYAFNYNIGEEEVVNADGTVVETKGKKKEINALICGVNDGLTDTMMYVKYNVESGKIAMMSIPRDTYVTNEYCIGHKLNAIYRGKNIIPLVNQIQDLIGVKIDYYLVFKADMLISMVDALGGIEVDVKIRMKYDDPTQNLHIDIQKGKQVLDGKNAEGYVRFRHNNDMTVGYTMGDLDRTEVQQEFIKTFISTVLQPSNLTKVPDLINIAQENTETNVTVREALRYVSDLPKLDTSNIVSMTAPGTAKYIDEISYFLLDKEKTRQVIESDFDLSVVETNEGTESTDVE
ncbi:MAG: LCP family protein [Clostridia bacterium]|nr:LCP family protein [Clostridia bacterium]